MAASPIGSHEQFRGVLIAARPHRCPPALEAFSRTFGRVMIHADAHPPDIGGLIGHAVRMHLAQGLVGQSLGTHQLWGALRAPFAAHMLHSPTRAVFFGSTETTGCPRFWHAAPWALMGSHGAWRSGGAVPAVVCRWP